MPYSSETTQSVSCQSSNTGSPLQINSSYYQSQEHQSNINCTSENEASSDTSEISNRELSTIILNAFQNS